MEPRVQKDCQEFDVHLLFQLLIEFFEVHEDLVGSGYEVVRVRMG